MLKGKFIIALLFLLISSPIAYAASDVVFDDSPQNSGKKNNFGNGSENGIIIDKEAVRSGKVFEDEEWIYYIDPTKQNSMFKEKLDGSNHVKLCEGADFFCIKDDWIYYVKINDRREYVGCGIYLTRFSYDIYRMDKNGDNKQKITSLKCESAWEAPLYSMTIKDELIYCWGNEDKNYIDNWFKGYESYMKDYSTYVRAIPLSLKGNIKNYGTNYSSYIYLDDEGMTYYYNNRYHKLLRAKTDFKNPRTIIEGKHLEHFNFKDGWIYYVKNTYTGKSPSIYKIKMDGTDNQLIVDMGAIDDMIVAGDNIYCLFNEDLYKMNLDGSNKTQVLDKATEILGITKSKLFVLVGKTFKIIELKVQK